MGVIAYIADLHLDCRNPDASDGSRYLREQEAWRLTDGILGWCVVNEVKTLVIAGDMAHYRNPRVWAYKVMGSLTDRLHERGIEVIAIRGNHDGSEHGRAEFGEAIPYLRYFSEPASITTASGHDLTLLPWFGRSHVAARAGTSMSVADQHAYMRDAAERILSDAKGRIVVTHFTISGAKYSSEAQPVLGDASEFMLPPRILSNAAYCIAGHVHKAQRITGPTDVVYPGSAILCDFGQENDVPTILLDRGQGPTAEPIGYEHLRFVTVNADVSEDGTCEHDDLDALAIEGAIVRVKATVPAGEAGTGAIARLMRDVEARGPVYMARAKLAVVRHDARVAHEMTTEQTPTEALASYAELVGGEYADRADELTALHGEIERSLT